MARERILDLEEYGISKKRYQELKWFCLQYEDKKERLSEILHATPFKQPGVPRGYDVGDPTMSRAMLLDNLLTDCEMIEQTALEVDEECYQFLIRYVTTWETAEKIGYPRCKNVCYRRRKAFYVRLHEKKVQRGT